MKSSVGSTRSSPPPSGVESTGLPLDGEQRAHLALARRLDLLAHRRDRQLAGDLRQSRTRLRQTPWWPGPIRPPPDHVDRRLGQHRPAPRSRLPVSRLSSWIDHCAQGAELLRGDADPAVHRGALGRRELAGQAADRLGGQAAGRLGRLRGAVRHRSRDPVQPGDVRRRSGQVLGEQHVHHGQQHVHVAAGADEVVLGRPPWRSRYDAGRGRRAGRRVPAARGAGRGSPARSSATRWRPSGWSRRTSRRSVRSRSGTGSSSWWPYIRWATSWAGSWSTEVALNRLRVRSALASSVPWVIEPRRCTLGLPR